MKAIRTTACKRRLRSDKAITPPRLMRSAHTSPQRVRRAATPNVLAVVELGSRSRSLLHHNADPREILQRRHACRALVTIALCIPTQSDRIFSGSRETYRALNSEFRGRLLYGHSVFKFVVLAP